LIAIKNLLKRRLRSWLTILGILVGIIAVVALISLGYGLQDSIIKEMQNAGTNRVIITPGGGSFSSIPVTNEYAISNFNEDDLKAVQKARGVVRATGFLVNTAKVEFNGEARFIPVFGQKTDAASTEYQSQISFFKLSEGRQMRSSDNKVSIVGNNVAKEFFSQPIKVGDKITINGVDFKIIGIQKKSGNPGYDRSIRIPIDEARELFNQPGQLSNIFAETDENADTNIVAENIKEELRNHRRVKEGEEDFTVKTSQQVLDSFKTILSIITYILAGIAAISLIVGSVGITNTMYTAVLERTKEIGIMKAIGATKKQILIIFIVESGMLGLIGGVIGVIIGFGLGKSVELIASAAGYSIIRIHLSYPLIFGALAFSYVIGSVAGILPALQASNMNAVDAIRK